MPSRRCVGSRRFAIDCVLNVALRDSDWKQKTFLIRQFPATFVDVLDLVSADADGQRSWKITVERAVYRYKRKLGHLWDTGSASRASSDERMVLECSWLAGGTVFLYIRTQSTHASGPLWLHRGFNIQASRHLGALVRFALSNEERARFGLLARWRFSGHARTLLRDVFPAVLVEVVHEYAWVW